MPRPYTDSEISDFTGQISIEDRICYVCYKAHLVIIKHTNNTTSSTGQDLSCFDRVKTELQNEQEISTQDQALMHSVRMSAVMVGEALLNQTALLLPEVFELTKSHGILLKQDLHAITNSNWLLSQLSAILEQHMAYRCSVKRYGTVFYRYGGDLLHALNVSLGQTRMKSNKRQPLSSESDKYQKKTIRCLPYIKFKMPCIQYAVCLITANIIKSPEKCRYFSSLENEEFCLRMHFTFYNQQSVLLPTSHTDI